MKAGKETETETVRQQRLARNEALYRTVNERIHELAEKLHSASDVHVYEYCCECANANCSARIRLTYSDYEAVREDSTHFVVASGHVESEIESVISDGGDYVVVAKHDEAARIAEATDPRR